MNMKGDGHFSSLLHFFSRETTLQDRIHWIFRISLAFCFVGHGAFGIITKAEWLPYFALMSLGSEWAYRFMPLVGILDIALGLSILFYPTRAAMLYMAFWTVWTAALRPLTGQGIWEFFERAGNYGIPIAFLIFAGPVEGLKPWFRKIHEPLFNTSRAHIIEWTLRLTTATLLIGHGGFGALMHKQNLILHFDSVGLPPDNLDPVLFLTIVGWFEIALGLMVLIKPVPVILLVILTWKVFTELLYPISGTPIWEFIERFGSYGAPLGLFYLIREKKDLPEQE